MLLTKKEYLKHLLSLLLVTSVFVVGCKMDERPIISPDKSAVFSSEEGLKLYSISFYDGLPSAITQADIEQNLVDYGAPRGLDNFLLLNGYSENNSSGWSWSVLRNINYFLVNNIDPAVSQEVRDNYNGLARFFRAWFYYDKVRRFGDVPWVDHPLDVSEEDILFGGRDSRELVMEKVYEDLMYAAQHISRTDDASQCTLITKWAAYAFASRVALFEGSFRKYHNLSLATSAETWFQRAEQAAKEVIDNSGKTLNPSYRELFTSDNPPHSETILALASDASLNVKTAINWDWTSETKGSSINLIRPFLVTYLMKDGTPYTDKAGWQYEDFYQEFQNRDDRLNATLRHPGYTRQGSLTLPSFGGYARLGYQPIKFIVDDNTNADDKTESTQAVQLIRFGEVLLNYAEAKAELGTLTDGDWQMTIGALRSRAGIVGGINSKPSVVDNYFKNTYFPDINDPVILEIRRERAIELVFEGFRFDDLRRWKRGDLFKMSWTGMYISGINKPLDVDHNGIDDVVYYTDETGLSQAMAQSNNSAIIKVQVSQDPNSDRIQVHPAGNGVGYYLAWFTNNDSKKVWGPKQYFYPIPINALNLNHDLKQNPGWEGGATNDGN